MPFDVIDEILNSGLETDAVLKIGLVSTTIKVIYYSKYKVSRIQQLDIGSVNPYLVCREEDIVNAKTGDSFTGLDDATLYIAEIQPQGQRKVIIQLKFD